MTKLNETFHEFEVSETRRVVGHISSYSQIVSFSFYWSTFTASQRSRSHLLLTIPKGMPVADASARLSFGRSEQHDLFIVVGPVTGGREEIRVGDGLGGQLKSGHVWSPENRP